ncbi:MAG: cydB [Caulobacter sp.]|nr:cydB [Caulobacter sp.]
MSLDLPLIWVTLIAVAVMLYVLLDGFDLGIGILFPFARSDEDRDTMMAAIAPVWDGNETWLVLGGGGLLAAFPAAYAVVMPAFYLPIMLMLMALILRGVAFEFRLHGRKRGKPFWTAAFAGGSFLAAIAQGLVLGGFIQGVTVRNGAFAGGPFDWLSPYSILTAAGVVAGYALLGAGWLVWKSEGELHGDGLRWARRALVAVAALLGAVSLATLIVHPQIAARWGLGHPGVDIARLAVHLPIPLLGLAGLALAGWGVWKGSHRLPFAGGAVVFLSGYLGLAVSFFPYVVPYALTFRQAANVDSALSLMLIGIVILLPAILGYTVWVYWLFRGKAPAGGGYH